MQVRVSEERHPSPSAAICDAQSVKVGNPRCHSIGFDGGKLIKGRKRHVLVDTQAMGGKLKQEIICQGLKIAIGRVKILAKKPCE
jgi:hypothetical protein